MNPSTGEPYDMGLPQCRAYEMASPQDKEGHDAWLFAPQMTFAAEGAIVYSSEGEFANPEGGTAFLINNPYRSSRSGADWLTTNEYPTDVDRAGEHWGSSSKLACCSRPISRRELTCGEVGEGSSITEPAIVCAIHEPDGSWVTSPIFPARPEQTVEKTPIL